MDLRDYEALDRFLKLTNNGHWRNVPRTPIMALHDASIGPGWSAVLVLYDRSQYDEINGRYSHSAWGEMENHFRVATYEYCPFAEAKYDRSSVPGIFRLWDNERPKEFTTGEAAFKEFIKTLEIYADGVGF